MMLAFAVLLLTGLALAECRAYTQILEAPEESDDHVKIVNGQEATRHSYPFIASLLISYGKDSYMCGGTLINNNYILTAAHCLVDDDGRKVTQIRVYLGAHNIEVNERDRIVRYGDKFIVKDYDSATFRNDVALIHLSQSVTFNNNVRAACIARKGSGHARSIATVAGWGALGDDMDTSDVLLEIDVPVLLDSSCNRLPAYSRGYDNDVMMCAGYTDGSKDSCQGDSGGPLFIRTGTGFTTIGVVSYGMNCAMRGYPGVYAQVEHFADWITESARDGGKVCVA